VSKPLWALKCFMLVGGFARVVKGEFDKAPVALKMLLPQWCGTDARSRRYQDDFLKEGSFLQQCNHT